MIVAAGGVLLVLVLAFELPKTLSRLKGSPSRPAAAASVPTTPVVVPETTQTAKAYRAALRQAPHDVFTQRQLTAENTLGAVATPAGLHDPLRRLIHRRQRWLPRPRSP